ncbi:alpha/beta fold hydrolase [Microbacterium sp. No. 7]|uniref:alpha/beta fold hydrolase n=1 Tax=Microbacterium sp. No. 7 TaxID=1714373 RepID=UPI0006D17E2E|nr:alpha/beta hydrolase [Microbacterium sp. No. 7]ALJ21230.1 hydrolase [Microbacterium sp. No. 7]
MDEFSFLPAQAAPLGVAVPPARRLTHTLDDGRTVSALRFGDAEPVVTLLHGAGLNAHTWDTTILALGLPAIAVDLPGHGDSSWRDDADYSGTTNAASVAPAIAAWTSAPQVLVGQSLGGLTAAAVADTHPELVRELVVIDVTPGISSDGGARQIRDFFSGPTDWASREELVERALSFGFGGSPEAAARGVFHNSRVRDDGRVEWKHHFARIANRLAADPDAAAEAARRQAASTETLTAGGWEHLAGVRAPITLVRGERGYVTEADLEEFRTRVPAATVVEVAAGHNVQEDIPVELAALVRGIAAR